MKMKTFLASLVALGALQLSAAELPVVVQQYLSPVYTIDKKYKSMEGPGAIEQVHLGDPQHPELLWIIGVHTEMVAADGTSPQLPELMCHVNIDLDPMRHQALFRYKRPSSSRLVTLSQGMLDAELPPGYGFPIASNEPLVVYTQVLNHNIDNPNHLQVRHRLTFEYVRDADLKSPMKPLFNVGASGTVLLQENSLALPMMAPAASDAGGAEHGTSCLLLPRAPNARASDYVDPQGRKVTGHWIVPPGRQENHSDITWFMALPFDTTIHYAAVHLHPFARSLAIRDTTTGQTVLLSKATGTKKGVGLAKVEPYASDKGIPLFRDHKYELVSIYNNPTKENADSMASVFLGVEDREFAKPDEATLANRDDEYLISSPGTFAVVRTSAGDFTLELLRQAAPATVAQFIRLARVGAYDRAKFTRSIAGEILMQTRPLADVQKAVLQPFRLEPGQRHGVGTASLCANDTAFSIVLASPSSRDGRCTAFANVAAGAEVMRAITMSANPDGFLQKPVEIRRVEIVTSGELSYVRLEPARASM
jgi:cyclophilin family peptidyl-prolyl cis-trans isomerase